MWLVVVVGRCAVKATVQLAGSCRRVGGVEQWVGFTGILFGNEPSRFVKCLYAELFIWG